MDFYPLGGAGRVTELTDFDGRVTETDGHWTSDIISLGTDICTNPRISVLIRHGTPGWSGEVVIRKSQTSVRLGTKMWEDSARRAGIALAIRSSA